MSLKDKWEQLYGYKQETCYGGDYNDGIHKIPLSYNLYLRNKNDNHKWDVVLSLFNELGIHDIPDYKILDVGCGNGKDLRRLCELGAKPENCYGIDFAENAWKYARKNSPQGMHYSLGNILDGKYKESKFHIAFLFNTLANIDDDEEIIKIQKEISRVLIKYGILFVIVQPSEDGHVEESEAISSGVIMIKREFSRKDIENAFPDFSIVGVSSVALDEMAHKKNIYTLRNKK